jgi:hypothetical protein
MGTRPGSPAEAVGATMHLSHPDITATLRRPSRTIRVEPVRRPDKVERPAPPRERSAPPSRERAETPTPKSPARARP